MIAPSPWRVLIVDDKQTTCDTLRELLEHRGRHVDTVGTCQEAIACVKKHALDEPYGLVIVDVRLPDGSGAGVVKSIKQATPSATCLIITASAEVTGKEEAIAAGAEDYYVKPLLLERLVSMMSDGGHGSAAYEPRADTPAPPGTAQDTSASPPVV